MDCILECNADGYNGGRDHARVESNDTFNGPTCQRTTRTWLGGNVVFLNLVGFSSLKVELDKLTKIDDGKISKD
jgi:hypothetical protein